MATRTMAAAIPSLSFPFSTLWSFRLVRWRGEPPLPTCTTVALHHWRAAQWMTAVGWHSLCPRKRFCPFGGGEGEAPTACVLRLDASACRCASRSRGTGAALQRRCFSGGPEALSR
jgi:hypothetical protein